MPEGNAIRVRLDHADGLNVKGGALVGFEVAGEDHKFAAATAKLDGVTVAASASTVANPVFVRYAWANAPAANSYNRDGLPASTFSSENSADTAGLR